MCHTPGMRATNIRGLRSSKATRLFEELRHGLDEPVLLLSNSEIVGYLVSSQLWDRTQAELKHLRQRNRELFWAGVEEAEWQADQGLGQPLNIDDLLAEHGLSRADVQ
jgi:hypothetical protein